jgi:excinuclease ABC subunit B
VKKDVAYIMECARTPGKRFLRNAKGKLVAESSADYSIDVAGMSPAQLATEIKSLEKKMFEHAKNLEFEEAANTRDRLTKFKQQAFIQ